MKLDFSTHQQTTQERNGEREACKIPQLCDASSSVISTGLTYTRLHPVFGATAM